MGAGGAQQTQAWVVMTHAETGKALYVQPHANTWLNALVASATLPMWTRGQVKWEEDWVFDGGYSDPLPLSKALELGAQRILVVRTRPSGDHITQSTTDYLASWWFQDRPASTNCLRKGMWRTTTRSTGCLPAGTGKVAAGRKLPVPEFGQHEGGAAEVMSDYRLGWIPP